MPIYLFLDGTGCVSIHTIELRWLNANTCNGLAEGSLPSFGPVHKLVSSALADKAHLSALRH